ncbi:MAG: hypothetical protein HZB64_05340 [Rhodocyclales bacterium]|nr:hypothetical protein [Rhodocyclales bacterium]
MKTKNGIALTLCSALLFATGAAEAHGGSVDVALGGALGGAAGAVIGQQVGGRNGALIGGALGAATGVYVVNDRGRRVEYVPAYAPAPVYVAPRPVVYYASPGYYVSERARGHGHWKHHGHHRDHDGWDDRHERHEWRGRHHWD